MLRFFKKHKKKEDGFTLIELIVVIAILAVLAFIITPKITGFIGTSKQSALESNARVLYNSVVLALSNGDIDKPGVGGETLSLTAIPEAGNNGEKLANYLDEWPTDPVVGGDEPPPLIVKIDGNGAIEVEDSENEHLVGAEID